MDALSDVEYDEEPMCSQASDEAVWDDNLIPSSPSQDYSGVYHSLSVLRITADANAGQNEVALEDGLWDSLPGELIDKILTWLPPAALFCFRCVCQRWKTLFSSPGWLQLYSEAKPRPSCTVMCMLGRREVSYFCHVEHKWYNLPLNPFSYLELDWELADVDGGLFCYQCIWSGDLWMCVCNPLTQSSKVLPPNYPHWGIQPTNCEILKLVVEREANSYKAVVLVHSSNPPSTVVFDSRTNIWTVCMSYPSQDLRTGSSFIWKKAIYTQCVRPNMLLAFDIDSGVWSEVETSLPCNLMKRHIIITHNDKVLLVQIDFTLDEPIAVWQLEENASSSSPTVCSWKWAKLDINVPADLRSVLRTLHSCFSQNDCLCFPTSLTNKWMTYNFLTRSWHIMPTWARRSAAYSWLRWEPRLDFDVEIDSGA